jgi:hypothetical protein
MKTSNAGKFNIILMRVLAGLQKSKFLCGKTLYLGTSHWKALYFAR